MRQDQLHRRIGIHKPNSYIRSKAKGNSFKFLFKMLILESNDPRTKIILYTPSSLYEKHLPVEYGLPTSFTASKLATAVVIIVVVATTAVVVVTAAAVVVVVRHTGDQTSAVAHHFAVKTHPAYIYIHIY